MPDNIGAIISIILGSSVITAAVAHFATAHRDRYKERKELEAKANASVLRRVELCYRIRRRAKGEDTIIKNLVHDIQEENEFYKSLLLVESKWYGERYSLYVKTIKMLTSDAMQKAWKKSGNPAAAIENEIKLDHETIEKLSRQFSLDSRRFFCLPKRMWMRIHDAIWKVKKYDF